MYGSISQGSIGYFFADRFEFAPQAGVALGTPIESNTITVVGSYPVSIASCTSTSCEYRIDGGAWTSAPATVSSGQTVQVRQVSSPVPGTTTDLALTLGPPVATTFSVTTLQAPAITSPSATTFTVGAAGSFTVTATGSPAPALSVTGALPTGVSFDAPTGVLSGTPAAGTGGSYPLTVTASNGVLPNAGQSFTLIVNEAPAVTSPNNVSFMVGASGNFTVTARGFPVPALSVTGALPTGVSFDVPTGVLSGTPAAGTAGSYPLTVTASNGVLPNASQSFTLDVTGLVAQGELSHGFLWTGSLAARPGPAQGQHLFVLQQNPHASYEVVVDAVSADVQPVAIQLLAAAGSIVRSAQPTTGVGASRSLRWMSPGTTPIADQLVRVRSGGCTTSCGPDDLYRLRFYETTLGMARFINQGSQTTVLIVQNPMDVAVTGVAYFWRADGSLLANSPFTLAARGTLVLNTSTVAAGSGGISLAHDAPYGALAAKAVVLDPATGLSFEAPLSPRER